MFKRFGAKMVEQEKVQKQPEQTAKQAAKAARQESAEAESIREKFPFYEFHRH